MNWIKKYSVYLIAAVVLIGLLFQAIMGDITFQAFLASPQFIMLFGASGLAALFSGIQKNGWLLNKKTHINSLLAAVAAFISVVAGDLSLAEFLPHIITLLGVFGFSMARLGVDDGN